jgi:pimeloyl-ACP methyl ester carboxylesterase
VNPPPVHYADTPEGRIAYQVVGDGPIDVSWDGRFSLDAIWDHPPLERFVRRLASFSRLIMFNPRGCGISDPFPQGALPSPEDWMTDRAYVLDAVGSEHVAIVSTEGAGLLNMLFAAAFPDRTQALVLIDSYATLSKHHDYPWGMPPELVEQSIETTIAHWGTGELLGVLAPELANDERYRAWFSRFERAWLNQASVRVGARWLTTCDVRGVLSAIKSPTLLISHAGSWVPPGHSRYLAEHIPGARLVERPGILGVVLAS